MSEQQVSHIERSLPCSPEAAFRLWTDSGEIKRWWGDPAAYRVVDWTSDLAPGGAWRAEFETPSGERFGAGGNYVSMIDAESLEWTWHPDWDPGSTTLIKMTFAWQDQGTLLVVLSEGFQNETERTAGEHGWLQIIGWLELYIQSRESRGGG